MVELANLLAALSMLATSISGLQATIASKLAASDTVALQQSILSARRVGAPPSGARSAYARAPYHKPALRYVYALGWMSGRKDRLGCVAARLDVPAARAETIKAIRSSAAMLRAVRRLHLTAAQAGTAFTNGFTSAC